MKLGALVNAQAGRPLRDPELITRVRDVVGSDASFLTSSAAEVPTALAGLRGQGCDTLLLVGGDGTFSGTLTPLLRVWPQAEHPAIALTCGGTVNTIAEALGTTGPPERVAQRLLEGEASVGLRRRPTVRVRADGGDPVDGMLFANGVGVRWLEMYYAESSRGLSGASYVCARIAASALLQSELAKRMFAPFRAELVLDGKCVAPRDYTVMVAGGIREIGLGFVPFLTAGSDPERIHLTVTGASALGLLRELPALQTGRQRSGSALGHHPLCEALVHTEKPQPWSIDAELFSPARELWLGAGPALDFVSVAAGFR